MLTRVEILGPTAANIARAAERLATGRLVAMPTETVYGLAADARDERAVARVFELKRRPRDHPLIVHLASVDEVPDWADHPPAALARLGEVFWPGPLTVVLGRAAWVPGAVTGGQATVALRVPSHPVARQLLEAFGGALAAPSANRFGRVSPTTAQHVAAEFPDADLLVLDGGPSIVGLESTILDLSGAAPRLLRPGGVNLEEVEAVLGVRVLPAGAEPAAPRAPGGLPSHYAPSAPVRLVGSAELDTDAALLGGNGPEAPVRVAVLALRPPPPGFGGVWEQLPADARGYGAELYAALRRLDAERPREILVERVPDLPAWLAVRDRLQRASAREPAASVVDATGPVLAGGSRRAREDVG